MSPRGKEQNEQMRAETLAKIDSAALLVFAEYGYHGATMRRIAAATGLSYGLVYHYFPSKAKIFRRLVDFALEGSLTGMRHFMSAPGTAWQRIEAYSAMIIGTLFDHDTSLYFLIMLQAMTQGKAIPGLFAHITRFTESYYKMFVPVIAEAQKSGEATPGDPTALAAAFFSFVQGLATLMFQQRVSKIRSPQRSWHTFFGMQRYNMSKKIIIIGAGMGGLATGIYGQLNGFDTTIFEAHSLPGGQCTSWNRHGYVFDACVHSFNGCKPHTRFNAFWQELGALPCDLVKREEYVSAVFPDNTYFHNYLNLERLEQHLKQISPADAALIDEYVNGLKLFSTEFDWFGILQFGSLMEKLSILPFMLPRLKYFRYTLGTFAERFKHPLLRKAFPYIRTSIPTIPLFAYLGEHGSAIRGDISWPRGGGITVSRNMVARYEQLGGSIRYGNKVTGIMTEGNRSIGVELENGTQHTADYVVSNADGRKTIMHLLSGNYSNKKVSRYCEPIPDKAIFGSVYVYLGVKKDLSAYPSTLLVFLDKPEVIGGHTCDHLDLQTYGFDNSMAPAGKGVIKVELFTKPSFFARLNNDKPAYEAEKNKIAEHVISLLEKPFPGLRKDLEVIDVATLHSWERFMGGTEGHNNYPNKQREPGSIRHVIEILSGLDNTYTLSGLKNFFFTGQWATSMGSLALNALSGRTVVQKICNQIGNRFISKV